MLWRPDAGVDQYYSSVSLDGVDAGEFERGVQLGVEEAIQTGRLFGWIVAVDTAGTVSQLSKLDEARKVILSRTPPDSTISRKSLWVSAFANERDGNACLPNTFVIAPSRRSRDLQLWDSAAEKFGAAQLNDRYRARFSTGMSPTAWVGWLSIKIISEAAFRTGTANSDTLRKFLVKSDTKFDGHKGVGLKFDPVSRVLMLGSGKQAGAECR